MALSTVRYTYALYLYIKILHIYALTAAVLELTLMLCMIVFGTGFM